MFDVRYEQAGVGAVAAFSIDIPVQPKAFTLAGGNPRLVIDLPAAAVLDAKGRARESGSLALGPALRGVRFAPRGQGGARIVFDLHQPAKLVTVRQIADGGGVRFEAELAFVEQTQGAFEAVPAPPPAPRIRRANLDQPVTKRPLIVLDAGHGGRDSGAVGPTGVQEKAVTLAASSELKAELESRGFAVRLSRNEDEYVPLETRVERAREWGADLFLSLHADSDPSGRASGASVYTLSGRGAERARRLSEDKAWGPKAGDPVISDILFDLTQRASVDRSAEFAGALLDRLEGVAPLLRNSKREAGFYVLLAPDVPAVLLEMGFISNRADERRLSTQTGRAPLIRAVAAAVEAHFAAPLVLAANE